MITREEAKEMPYFDEATVDGENFRIVVTLQEFKDTIDKIYDSRGTCGTCDRGILVHETDKESIQCHHHKSFGYFYKKSHYCADYKRKPDDK